MMTAHVIYAAVDDVRPATISPDVVTNVIRGSIGFDGLLITDDLSMKALAGSDEEKASAALAAGCDVLLHCNGERREMEGVARGATALSEMATERFDRARAAVEGGRRLSLGERQDFAGRLDAILEGA